MDIASPIYHLTVGIAQFISEHDDKDMLYEQISNIVIQIQNVMTPLLLREITDVPLKQVLHSLQTVLSNVNGHLHSWKESRSRRMIALVNPWAVTQEIKEDRLQLMNQYIMLMGAMQVVDHVKGYNLLVSDGADPPSSPQASGSSKQKVVKEEDVLEFWHSEIGNDLEVVKSQQLCEHLSTWLGRKLGRVARKRLLLRLDENNSGCVTLKTLQDLVRDGNLKDVIHLYSADPGFPLLVWISDDIALNAPSVAYARSRGVTVVQLASTSTAKAWIKVNQGLLKKHDSPADLRFISDQVRVELNSERVPFRNRNAGEQITQFIRDEGFQAPIIIMTTKYSLRHTRYVDFYTMAGSMVASDKAYKEFVSALGARRKDDTSWVGFGG